MGDGICFAGIDPGQKTGVAIFTSFGDLKEFGTLKYTSMVEYISRLEAMREKHHIRFAVIDDYRTFGKRFVRSSEVQAQIRACKEVFEQHITILSSQWNPGSLSDRMKKARSAQIYDRIFQNDHVVDAVLIGHTAWNLAKYHFHDQPIPFEFLTWLAENWKRWPKKGEYHLVRAQRMVRPEMAVMA
jgi:hypothetical protein